MITTDDIRKAYTLTGLTPHFGMYIDAKNKVAHPLGAILAQRCLPPSHVYEYFGPEFVDDFNLGFFNLDRAAPTDPDAYTFGANIRELVGSGALLQEEASSV